MDRRAFLGTALAGAAGFTRLSAQQGVSPTPSTRDFTRQDPVQYPDPDVIALDPRFDSVRRDQRFAPFAQMANEKGPANRPPS